MTDGHRMDIPKSVNEIAWNAWHPTDHATLLFVIQDGRILLIRKKRGLGAGKINGPGGRIQEGETAHDCAVREVREELRITARNVRFAGTLRFQFMDGYSIQAEVFMSDGFDGTPSETDEAVPLWFPVDRLPYDEMWPDDRLWIPLLFAGRRFSGRFVFDGDRMLDAVVEET